MGFVEKELLLNIRRKRIRTHATKMLGMPKNVECYQHDNTIEQNRGCTRTRPHGQNLQQHFVVLFLLRFMEPSNTCDHQFLSPKTNLDLNHKFIKVKFKI
jgi:hypothetical protein